MSEQPTSERPLPVLYERAGCHLCEQAAALLDAALGTTGYRRVDIDVSDDLVLRYGFRVPVVSVDGIDRLEAPIAPAALAAFVREIRRSGG